MAKTHFAQLDKPDGRPLAQEVRLAQSGDQAALSRVIQVTQDRLYRFCLYLCGSPARAQDLCQDSFVRAIEGLRKLQDPECFESWLLKTAKNLYLDYVKSPKNADACDLEDPAAEGLPDDLPEKELVLQIRAALSGLKPQDRLILLLVDLEGHSYAEAAEITGITESTLRFRLHHIRKAFVEAYNK